MENIKDLLDNRASSAEPPQVKMLKQYFKDKYDIKTKVQVSAGHYSATVPNGAIASDVRVNNTSISRQCNLDKKLIVRIDNS